MIKYICIYVFSVFISAISQILLKISAKKNYRNVIKEYFNPLVITAYGIFFCSSILTIIALKCVPLSLAPVIESAGYIFVAILGYICLHETIGKRKAVGIFFIFVGIIVSSM